MKCISFLKGYHLKAAKSLRLPYIERPIHLRNSFNELEHQRRFLIYKSGFIKIVHSNYIYLIKKINCVKYFCTNGFSLIIIIVVSNLKDGCNFIKGVFCYVKIVFLVIIKIVIVFILCKRRILSSTYRNIQGG